MRKELLGSVSALVLAVGVAAPASAGNIVLTGHDNDFHQSANAKAATLGALNFVKNGSVLPVLTFDAGTELTSLLTSLGQTFTNVNPSSAISNSVFDNSLYSAFVVASVTSCGGCDNTPADIANIASDSAAIATFFNNGGGIYGLAGAGDAAAYAYVPATASNAGGSPPSSGFYTTADGVLDGIPAVNGDATHNFFSEPGTGGLSSLYNVTERLCPAGATCTPTSGIGTPETIALAGGKIVGTTIVGGGAVPEPGTLALFGAGLAGLVLKRRRKNKAAA